MFPIVEAGSPALEGTSLPAFVVARDGLYLRKRSMLGLSQTKVDRVAHLPRGKAFLDYRLPKLPSELVGQVVGFFRARAILGARNLLRLSLIVDFEIVCIVRLHRKHIGPPVHHAT